MPTALRIMAGLGIAVAAAAPADDPRVKPDVTFTRDIAPIVYQHCAPCHRPGESAPFALLTYADVRKRDRQIVDVTERRFMPPWLPERGVRAFVDERGLSDEEIGLFRRWREAGAAEGDPADLPPLPKWTAGWALGEPDLVIEPAESYTLPADGTDIFRNLVIPIPVDQRRYVRTIDLRPGNPRIVHHAVMRVDPSRSARLLDQRDEEPGYPGMEWGEAQPPAGHFLGWTPGRAPYAGAEDRAWVLEPGGDLVVQLHMLPTGKPEAIRPQVGLYFAEGPPRRPQDTIVLDVRHIDIPAGEREYVVEESYQLPVDVELVSVYPHAHYLGRELTAWATLPDGSRLGLLRIPDWDFDWQDQYRYTEPVRLPRGSRVALRYTYDNSSGNLRNPSVPPRRVVSGNRSTDEMGSLSFEALLHSEAERQTLRESLLRQDLAKWPDLWTAHGLLGKLLLDRADLQGAILHLQRAVAINPDYAVAHNNLGTALTRSGRSEPAVASFRRALERRPHYADAHYNLGVELAATGRLDEAIRHYELALAVRGRDAELHNNLGIALALQGQEGRATEHFRRALAIDPDSSDACGNLGNLLLEQGWYADAIEHYRRALRGKPDSRDLQANLSIALEVMREIDARLPGLERAAAGARPDAHLLGELADLYAAKGRYGEALATARRAFELASAARAGELARTLSERLAELEAAVARQH